jgi:hypothetical protein
MASTLSASAFSLSACEYSWSYLGAVGMDGFVTFHEVSTQSVSKRIGVLFVVDLELNELSPRRVRERGRDR